MESSKDFKIEKRGENAQHIYLTPLEKHTHTLIWMHGLGDTAEGYFDMFENLQQSPCPKTTKIVLLTAPVRKVTVNFGMQMTSWFDFREFDIRIENFEKAISIEEIKENARLITFVIEDEIAQLDGKSKNVFIGGFS